MNFYWEELRGTFSYVADKWRFFAYVIQRLNITVIVYNKYFSVINIRCYKWTKINYFTNYEQWFQLSEINNIYVWSDLMKKQSIKIK